jgi:uncharacterized protein (DUF2236 family)
MRQLFAGPPSPSGQGSAANGALKAGTDSRDAGLFGPDSVTWRVHSHMSVLVGGFRSLLVQTLHPLAMAGVAGHSNYRTDPLGRLQRTANFVGATTYGTTEQAEAAIDRVRRVHGQVRGTASDGRPYSATDPELLAWVHHVEVESFLLAYQRLGPGLEEREADQYVAEMAGLGARLGVEQHITTAAALHDWVRNHPDQRVSAEARAAVRFLLVPPLPLAARGPYAVLLAGAISLIPVRDRRRLGLFLPGAMSGKLACEPAARAMVAALGWAMGPSPALANARARIGA